MTEVFAAQLRLDVADVARDADFAELGVDSIMIAQLLTTLERELGVVAEPSALLEHPTIGLLAGHLRDQIPAGSAAPRRTATSTDAGGDGDGERPVSAQVAAEPRAGGAPAGTGAVADGIAVVGMACHLPGAPDHQTFWRNLLAGVDSIGEVPRGRWDIDRYHSPTPEPGRSVSRWGGFLDGIEDFDPEHFRLDPAGAAQIDPLVRQFLEVSAECLADAGLRPEDVAGSALGVFAGARSANFGSYHSGPGRDAISGMAQNFIAAHVSHFLDVHGPAVVIDSACSSSLVSVHLAAQSLRSGESDLALAGGVEILLDQVPFVGLSEAGALSPTGRCRTFDEGADGIVLGEGAGVLLLKRLPDALRAGDPIHAVLEGSAVNNDGRTMGITTPNPRAQQRTIERAWRAAGVDADRIGYVEAHGTGTRIGDPMELKALTEAFRGSTAEVGFCGVGSVKTNIGHALSAAGIAGLLKVVLAVRHGQLPPTLHCPDLNRRFRFEESPLYPVREAREWAGRDGVRRGAVSSFGFGGTNAHMVVRQAPDGRVPARTSLPPVRYRRRRFWFTDAAAAASGAAAAPDDAGVAPAETGPRTNGARPGEPPAAPFFELQF